MIGTVEYMDELRQRPVNAHYRAAMAHYVLHARPIAEIDQVIAEHPDLAEANARLDRLYVWEER